MKVFYNYLVVFLLLSANCLMIYFYEADDISRWVRVFTTAAVLTFMVLQKNFSKKIFVVFILLVLADIIQFRFDTTIYSVMFYMVRIIAYVVLIFMVLSQLKKLKFLPFQKIQYLAVIAVNLVIIYLAVDMVPERFHYSYLNLIFYVYGILMVTLLLSSILFNSRFMNDATMYFVLASFCLVLSDITAFVTNYMELPAVYYAERLFYVLATVNFAVFGLKFLDSKPVQNLETL